MKTVLFFVIFIFSFSSLKSSEYGDLTYGIMNSYSTYLKKSKNLELAGSGGSMPADVKKIILEFDSPLELDLVCARRLFVESAQGLLNIVNRDKKIRPYLHDYPFTCRNIGFGIGFMQRGKWAKSNKIAYVFIAEKNIFYTICKSGTEDLEDFFQEPYEEALRIVQQENAMSLLKLN
jgi:hypothetical protein